MNQSQSLNAVERGISAPSRARLALACSAILSACSDSNNTSRLESVLTGELQVLDLSPTGQTIARDQVSDSPDVDYYIPNIRSFGEATELRFLPGHYSAYLRGLSVVGSTAVIVGESVISKPPIGGISPSTPIVWRGPDFVPVELPHDEPVENGAAQDVNSSGVIIGNLDDRLVTWHDEGKSVVVVAPSGASGQYYLIGDGGHIVGTGGGQPRLWMPGADEPRLLVGRSTISAINPSGQLVATETGGFDKPSIAVAYAPEEDYARTVLAAPNGPGDYGASEVDPAGRIAGWVRFSDGRRDVLLWRSSHEEPIALTDDLRLDEELVGTRGFLNDGTLACFGEGRLRPAAIFFVPVP